MHLIFIFNYCKLQEEKKAKKENGGNSQFSLIFFQWNILIASRELHTHMYLPSIYPISKEVITENYSGDCIMLQVYRKRCYSAWVWVRRHHLAQGSYSSQPYVCRFPFHRITVGLLIFMEFPVHGRPLLLALSRSNIAHVVIYK